MTRTSSEASVEAEEVSLQNAGILVMESARLLRTLDKQRPPQGNNSQRSAVKRDLLYLADTLDRAAAEVRAQYHAQNGRPDILEST